MEKLTCFLFLLITKRCGERKVRIIFDFYSDSGNVNLPSSNLIVTLITYEFGLVLCSRKLWRNLKRAISVGVLQFCVVLALCRSKAKERLGGDLADGQTHNTILGITRNLSQPRLRPWSWSELNRKPLSLTLKVFTFSFILALSKFLVFSFLLPF